MHAHTNTHADTDARTHAAAKPVTASTERTGAEDHTAGPFI